MPNRKLTPEQVKKIDDVAKHFLWRFAGDQHWGLIYDGVRAAVLEEIASMSDKADIDVVDFLARHVAAACQAAKPKAAATFQIAIDGPTSAGKTSTAKAVAGRLGCTYLDTGAIFRAVAYHALSNGKNLDDMDAAPDLLVPLCVSDGLELRHVNGHMSVFIGGRCVDGEIRTPEVSDAASRISVHPSVRAAILDIERAYARGQSVVAEGRDIGTNVFPSAGLKIFLTAKPEVRAERRRKQLAGSGTDVSHADVLKDITERDTRDSTREADPLRPASDCVLVDNSDWTLEQTVERIVRLAGPFLGDGATETPSPAPVPRDGVDALDMGLRNLCGRRIKAGLCGPDQCDGCPVGETIGLNQEVR